MDIVVLALARTYAKNYTDSVALNGVPVNYPKIVSGTWQVYDPAAGAYIDTGVKATGKDGETPHIDPGGNWFVGTADTGVKATGENGKQCEFRKTATHIQWRYAGESWQDLVLLDDITGKNGETPQFRIVDDMLQYKFDTAMPDEWTDLYKFTGGGGVPPGGTAGQVLAKKSSLDSDVEWANSISTVITDDDTILGDGTESDPIRMKYALTIGEF